jgi:hypothetical protein
MIRVSNRHSELPSNQEATVLQLHTRRRTGNEYHNAGRQRDRTIKLSCSHYHTRWIID